MRIFNAHKIYNVSNVINFHILCIILESLGKLRSQLPLLLFRRHNSEISLSMLQITTKNR